MVRGGIGTSDGMNNEGLMDAWFGSGIGWRRRGRVRHGSYWLPSPSARIAALPPQRPSPSPLAHVAESLHRPPKPLSSQPSHGFPLFEIIDGQMQAFPLAGRGRGCRTWNGQRAGEDVSWQGGGLMVKRRSSRKHTPNRCVPLPANTPSSLISVKDHPPAVQLHGFRNAPCRGLH
jgi:hypothetical protein